MNYNNSASIGTCHGTTTRKLFGTFGTKQFRVTSCRVLLQRTPKRKCCAHTNPDPQLCQGVGIRKKKRIRNNMDEAEVGAAVVMCYKCLSTGHTYKKCTKPQVMLAIHHLRVVWAHQQLQDYPNPHLNADADVGVGPTQNSDDHNFL
jgi:hypothetical protein